MSRLLFSLCFLSAPIFSLALLLGSCVFFALCFFLVYLIRALLFSHLYSQRHLGCAISSLFSVIHQFLTCAVFIRNYLISVYISLQPKVADRSVFCFISRKNRLWGTLFLFCDFLVALHCDLGVVLMFLLCAALQVCCVLDGFVCVCHACCRRKCVLLSESDAHYASTTFIGCVSGFYHILTLGRSKSWESSMLLPQTTSQLWIELRGSLAWFDWGALLRRLPWPLCRVADGFVGPGPGQLMGERVLGKVFQQRPS